MTSAGKNAQGKWTAEAAKHGIKSNDDFLKSTEAQDVAAQDFFQKKAERLSSSGAMKKAGQRVVGVKGEFVVTEAGLLAAAHRDGEKVVNAYLRHQEKNGWTSRFDNLDPNVKDSLTLKDKNGNVVRTAEDRLRAVETRIRRFEKVKK